MPIAKRTRKSYAARAETAKKRGRTGYANVLRQGASKKRRVDKRVDILYRMIETKEGQYSSAKNVGLPHNQTYVVQKADATDLNLFQSLQQANDPMNQNNFNRIGDKISVKGVKVKGFVECAANRPKVFFRIMLLRCPRGQAPTRVNGLFKDDSNNKMIDCINTEKFGIIWQTTFNCTASNPITAGAVGVPGEPAASTTGGVGTRIFSAWIPGRKFGRNGIITYEDSSTTNVKYYDYRFVILTYDWYGTPQDVNNVGKLNEMYSKVYFKDA